MKASSEPPTRHWVARRLRAMVRLAIALVLLLLVVFAGGALFLASSQGTALVLRILSASVRNQLGVEARAAGLEYRPSSLGITLHAVNLRQSTAARPFFKAERVEVDFSAAILHGSLVLRRLGVTRPEIVLDSTTQAASAIRAADREGQAHARSSAKVPSFDIRGGRVSDLALTAVSPNGTQVAVRGLSLSFTGERPGGVRGALVVSGGWSFRRGPAAIRFDRARANVSLTGTSLAFTSITMESPVAAIGGTAYVDLSRGDLDVTYDARVALGKMQQWLTALPPLEGELEASGTVGGTLDHPVASFDGRVKRLQWQEVTDASVSVAGRWSDTDLTIDQYSASSRALGVNVTGRARLVVGDHEGSSSVRAEASVDDARRLAPVARTSVLPATPLTFVADLTWPGWVLGPESLAGRIQMAVLNPATPRTTIATVDAAGERGRWRVHSRGALEGDTSFAADISVLLDRASLLQSTLAGRFGAQSAKLEDAVRDLRRRGLLPADLAAVLHGGRATAHATLTGTVVSPRLEAMLTADSLILGGVEQVRGEAQVHLDGRAVEITRMTAEASGNRLDIHGTATAGNGPIHLAVDARLDRPEVLAAALPAEWRPSGSLVVSGTLDGSPANPRLAARISGSGLEANGIVVDSLEGDVTFAHGVLNVTGLRLNRGGGWLRLEANIDRPHERMRISGRGEKLAVPWAQTLHLDDASVEFDVTGSPRQPTGTFSMVAGDVAINGRTLGRVELMARSAGRAVRFDVGLPTVSADVSGSIGFEPGWPFEARANLRRTPLTSLAALLKRTIALPDTSATITASADVTGQLELPLESTGVITISEIEGQLRGRPLRLVQPGRIRLDGRRSTLEAPLRITWGGVSMGLTRVRDRENGVMITLEGRLEEGIAFLSPDMLVPPWRVEGPVRAQVSLEQDGDRFAIAGDGDATIDRLMRSEGELARGVHLQARIRGRAIEFSATDGVVLGGPFSATGRMPLAWALPAWLADGLAARGDISPIEATVSVRSDAMLAPALQALGIKNTNMSGTATTAIEAHAAEPRLSDVVAAVTIEAGEISVDDLGLTQQVPTRLRFDRGRLEVGALDWKGPRSFLTASGAIGVLPGTEGEFRADGTTSLTFLRLMVAGIGGEATFQVRVAGPPGARAASANINLNDVNIIERDFQLALAGLSGPLTLEAGVLDTRGLRGQLNGGDLTIEGAIPVRAGAVAPRPLNVAARGLFVEIPKGLRSQLDTHLTWENTAEGPRLSGQITTASESYREPITALASSISAFAPDRGPRLPVPPWVAATALDIRLNSIGPIVVDQSMLNVELVPDLRVTGTVGRPALDGQVTIQDDGRIRVGGRSYRLAESRLEFSPAAGLLPRLNLIGETHVSSYLVTLRMVGRADQLETNFSSDPPLSERDVRSLLVSGQIADPARGTTDSNTFAVGAVSSDVLGVAGQFVGLDTVSVGTEDLDLVSSDVDPATRLTVSKRLGTKFELVLSENLEENESTWIVIYRPVSGYEFRVSSEDNTKEAFEFRQEITFGPGVPSRTRARAATVVVQDRIRAVALAGDPGFSAEQVLAGTKLRQGDRFEFRAWLEDRDRIVRFYRDREHYTARVVPMRTAAESTGTERLVDLEYRITRGPRTVLEVTGYAVRDDLLNHLRQTWSDNVVLDLLDDRLTKATREHLIHAGFLRARIEVEVDRPDSDTDRARVRIDPGPRTASRELAFRGNQVLTTRTLQELTASGRLEADAWTNPAPLIAAIRAAYAARGHLAAEVTIGPIEFADDVALLPIRIDEGRVAQVAAVHLIGVAPERRAGALEAIALARGAPFAAGSDRSGRARLEGYYRNLGFRDVQVETAATPASGGKDMALTFTVNEGPLHVISSVEIEGVQSTAPTLVSKAVQLMPGEPAGAAAVSATEKRLYELGTFRRAEVRLEPISAPGPVQGILPVKAMISLEETRRFQLRYGLEMSSDYNSALDQRTNALGVAADIRDRNFLGRGMSLGGGLRYEPDLRSARALFSVPTLGRRPIRTNLFLTGRGETQRDEQLNARDDQVNLTIEQRWRVSRAIEYSWGYSRDWRDVRLTHATGEALGFNGILASLNGAVVVDRRDSFFDATRGWFGSVSLQWGQREFGSDLDYLRTLIRGSYYQPLGPVVLAGNLRWGRLVPLGGPFTPTIFDLFFNAGGTESVRGYSQDALSAYSFFDARLGGTKLVVGNVELRAPLFWRLSGVLFADAGNTFANAQPIRLNELGVGLGFGLRINTPLAPIRIDLGFPRSFGETGVRWHFSIGQMF